MRKFLHKISVFLLFLVILSMATDYVISNLLKQSHEHPAEFEVMNDIYNGNASSDIAIYGSSRAWVQIDPQIIKESLNVSAYNFGIDGHNFHLQYLRHLELLKYNNKPKQIIVSLDMFSFQKRIDLYQPDQFLPYMLWNSNVMEYTASYIGYNKVDYIIPLIRYSGKTSAVKTSLKILFTGKGAKKYRQNGFKGMGREWNSDLKKAKARNEKYESKLDSKSILLFYKFIKECKELNIGLILVYTPEYIDGQKFVHNRKEVMDFFEEISFEYNLPFIDYSNDKICFNKSLFYNSSHLNKKGSKIFTHKLVHYLKNLNVLIL